MVTLTTGQTSTCGSSLLTNTRLVTAAHCWRTERAQGRSMTVVLGSLNIFSGGQRPVASNIQLHASYNMRNLNNDIAIITIPWVSYTSESLVPLLYVCKVSRFIPHMAEGTATWEPSVKIVRSPLFSFFETLTTLIASK